MNPCVYTLSTFFPNLRPVISCTARNIAGGCRFKVTHITLQQQGLFIFNNFANVCRVFAINFHTCIVKQ
jgi:hypothetical protein